MQKVEGKEEGKLQAPIKETEDVQAGGSLSGSAFASCKGEDKWELKGERKANRWQYKTSAS